MANELQQIAELLQQINRKVDDLPANLKLSAKQVFASNLSQISSNAGVLTSGEFRSGNGLDTGGGFTGVRIAFPAMSYNSELWNLVGVSNDVLQFGMKAADGKLYAANGSVIMDASGITATGGTIGGWTIGNGTISSGATNIILDATNKKISINDATYGNAGIQIDYNSGTPRFYVGNGSDVYFEFDGTNLNYSGGTINNIASGSEFRTGNGVLPGSGFTGFRIAYPAMSYAGDTWLAAAVNNDVLEVGFNSDGKAYFAGGDAVMDSTGLNFNRLNYAFRQTATNEGNTRIGKVSMTTLTGSTIPVLSIEYGTPVTTELCLNGGAELNAFTNWTKTKEIRGAWSVVTSPVYAGTYAFAWTPTTGGSLGILTSDRIAVADTNSYRASGALYNSTAVDDGYGIIYINWYDAASAGNWIRMDVLGRMEFTTTGWAFYEESKTPPTGALSAEFVIVIGDVTNE